VVGSPAVLARKGIRLAAGACAIALLALLPGCGKYGALKQQWSYKTDDTIAATPALNGGRVFIGSWDGYEYALDEATGALKWRTFLGRVPNPGPCDDIGVTSSPLTIGGTLYLGGGDDYWYALNMYTGSPLWRVFTGDTAAGYYNWSTPAELNHFAYVGAASLCDTPLVQGKLYRVDMTTHQIVNTFKVVADGETGGTIWTKPVVDAARNAVFVTTGNRAYDSNREHQPYGEAMLSLDATTLAVKGVWSLPLSEPTPDADWGTAPLFFQDGQGHDRVSAGNKNGVVYAFSRDNVSAGPIWSRRIANGAVGSDPAAGGAYSNGIYDFKKVYYAGGATTINGQAVKGSIRALNPLNGAIIWETPLDSKPFGQLAYANGMIVVSGKSALYMVDAANGEILYQNDMTLYAGAAVKNNRIVIGDYRGVVHAYTEPSGTGPPSAAAASIALARGCQQFQQPPIGAGRVRATRTGRASAPATIGVYGTADCSGHPIVRTRLRGGHSVVVKVRRMLHRKHLWVRSSSALRLKLRLAR
jgi:outer membrane protein assembly factor BamB